VLRSTAADVVPPGDTAALVAVLRRRYLQYQRSERPVRLGADARFSRRNQATVLFDALERLLAEKGMAPVSAQLSGGRR